MVHGSRSAVFERQLLDDYQAGDFFLASPNGTVLGKGVFAKVPDDKEKENQLEGLAGRIGAVLQKAKEHGYDHPIIVGAVPFDVQKEVQLIVPETIAVSGALKFDSGPALPLSVASPREIKAVPEPALYVQGVKKGLHYIETGRLSKIVLSRSLRLTASDPIDIDPLLRNLARHNPLGYTFAVDLPKQASGESDRNFPFSTRRTLIGASPELLVSRSGWHLTANPLAGSRPRSLDPAEDQELAAELLASAKDLHEHEVVAGAVVAALRPYCRRLDAPGKPSLIHTETMWHLSTRIEGELADPSTSSLDLAIALHPTPAVCGSPTEPARAAIREIEPFDRGFFAGMVGWCDTHGNGEWAVTLRCAEVEARSLQLFAGAGVVAGSKPEEELAETAAKFRTMLLAMGLDKEWVAK